jgi:hypothetical protein
MLQCKSQRLRIVRVSEQERSKSWHELTSLKALALITFGECVVATIDKQVIGDAIIVSWNEN